MSGLTTRPCAGLQIPACGKKDAATRLWVRQDYVETRNQAPTSRAFLHDEKSAWARPVLFNNYK